MKNRIRELRKKRGITMKQLGEVVGLAESTISQYETGKREPDNETLLRLGEFFGVTTGYMLRADQAVRWRQDQWDDYHRGSPEDKTMMINMWGCPPELNAKPPTPEGEREIGLDDFTYAMHKEGKELSEESKKKLLEMAKFFKQQQKESE